MPSFPLLDVQAGSIALPLSVDGELHRLVKLQVSAAGASSGHWPIPAARSYDGHPWEALYPAAGETPVRVTSCAGGLCNLTLSPAQTGFVYRVIVDKVGATTWEGSMAKLLMHTTK